jgi:hypothetical protein
LLLRLAGLFFAEQFSRGEDAWGKDEGGGMRDESRDEG